MNIKKVVLSLCFILTVIAVIAQPGGDPNGGVKPAPISGIEWLLAGGGLLGLRRIFNRMVRKH